MSIGRRRRNASSPECASTSRSSTRRAIRSTSTRTTPSTRRTSSAGGFSCMPSTSSCPLITVSGVRSSWEASAMKFAWRSNASCRRSSMWSKERASDLDLVPAPLVAHPGPEVALVDPGRNAGHPAQGGGHPRGHEDATHHRAEQPDGTGEEEGVEDVVACPVGGLLRRSHAKPQDAPPGARGLGEQPELARVGNRLAAEAAASGQEPPRRPRRPRASRPTSPARTRSPPARAAPAGWSRAAARARPRTGAGTWGGTARARDMRAPAAAHGRPGRAPPPREAGPCRRGGPARCARRAAPRFAP